MTHSYESLGIVHSGKFPGLSRYPNHQGLTGNKLRGYTAPSKQQPTPDRCWGNGQHYIDSALGERPSVTAEVNAGEQPSKHKTLV